MIKKKINIGFDIGITSVGWAIVDEENNIIDRGVRLFEELKKDGKLKNQERREKRSARRMLSRRKNRKDDFIKLIVRKYQNIFGINELATFEETKNNFLNVVIGKNTNDSVIDMILEGLKSEIPPLSLVRVLYYYLSHRGYSYMTLEQWKKKNGVFNIIQNNNKYLEFSNWYELNNSKEKKEIEEKANQLDYKNELNNIKNIESFLSCIKEFNKEKEYLNKLPSEIQKIEFSKYGYLRGNVINSSFSKYQWKEEIEKLLNNQTYLPNDFKEDYLGDEEKNKLGIFNRLRDFSEGPGSEKSPTDYGLWRRNENGEIVKEKDNLWDWTIGKCSVFTNEDRANKKSCSSEISNILNQLNTIEIVDDNRKDHKLTENEKKEIIFTIISKKTKPLKIISSICNTDIKNIYKYPTKEAKSNTSKENENLEKLSNTKNIFRYLRDELNIRNYDDLINNKKLFNDIIDVFSKYPSQFEKIEKHLKEIKLSDDVIKELIRKKIDSQSTSSMSLKALDLYIKEEIKDKGLTLNQKFKNIIDENEIKRFDFNTSNSKYINPNCLDNKDFILSPTTKCSFREVLKIFNKILKRFVYNASNDTKQQYQLKNIVMEMPTEWNSVDERKKLTNLRKYNEEQKELVKTKYQYEGNDKTIIQKLVLLSSQDNRDVYSGEFLDAKLVIDNPNYSEIDHIIPWAISYDDSINNKVLVSRESNRAKGKKTPKEYLGTRFVPMMEKWEDLFLNNESTQNKKKFQNLCLDIKSDEFRRFLGFVGRNLADTRYACRIAKQALNSWLDNNDIKNKLSEDGEVNIITVNGRYTQQFRKQKYLNITKNRDEDYSHHAVDATICAILGNSVEDMGKLIYFKKVNENTGEIELKNKFISFFNKDTKSSIEWNKLADSVKNSNVKFSYKMNKKSNFGFWGDSIVSVKKELNDKGKEVYKQYPKVNLLNKWNRFEELNKECENGKTYPDPKLWNDLLEAYNQGKKIIDSNKEYEGKNPFDIYMQEYCKQNNLGDHSKYKTILLSRINSKGDKYQYSVSCVKDAKDITSFNKSKRNLSSNIFGAFTKMEWKEIRLFRDNKNGYKIIPMRINLYDNHMRNIINVSEYQKVLKENNIINDSFFKIYKGTLIINKNNNKDIKRIAGGDFNANKLDIQEIYKRSEQNPISINTVIKDYYFVNIDELGNMKIIKDLKI